MIKIIFYTVILVLPLLSCDSETIDNQSVIDNTAPDINSVTFSESLSVIPTYLRNIEVDSEYKQDLVNIIARVAAAFDHPYVDLLYDEILADDKTRTSFTDSATGCVYTKDLFSLLLTEVMYIFVGCGNYSYEVNYWTDEPVIKYFDYSLSNGWSGESIRIYNTGLTSYRHTLHIDGLDPVVEVEYMYDGMNLNIISVNEYSE